MPDAPARVDARPQRKADCAGGQLFAVLPGGFGQRLHAGARFLCNGFQPGLDQRAVFVRQRHNVRHGADRHDVKIGLERVHAAQRLHQLCRHAHARQIREGISAQPRIDDHAIRQHGIRMVMVGHKHVQPQLSAKLHLFDRCHAAVHRHHQIVFCSQLPHRVLVKAVAFLMPVGNVITGVQSQRPEVEHQQRRCSHTVRIIVAVDADTLLFRYRLADAIHRLLHTAEQERIVQLVQTGMQIFFRRFTGCDTAQHHQLRHAQRQPHGAQALHRLFIQFGASAEFQHVLLSSGYFFKKA